MKSIQSRLISGLFISLVIVFSALWFSVSYNIQKLSENYITTRLEHDIESLLTAISFNKENRLTLNEKYINAIYHRPFSGHYYTIHHNNNIIRSRSLWDKNLQLQKQAQIGLIKSNQPGPDNQSLITLTAKYTKQGQKIILMVAEDLTPVVNDINAFKNYFSVTALLILLSLLLLQFYTLRGGLKPLRQLQIELGELEKGNIKQLTTEVPAELKSVVGEVNHLSLALYKRLKRSRDALSDLSHAIKKPLTLLQHFNDQNKHKLDTQSSEYLAQQIKTMQHLTDRILKQARIAGSIKHNSSFIINDDLSMLIKTISAMYPGKVLNINTHIPDNFMIYIDREDMLELLGNIMDNAWKWAEKTVSLEFHYNSKITIIIEDDGPGTNASTLNELIQRGVRLDESIEGYGFGLAISADIIQDNNGTIEFSKSEKLNGFKATIQLPATE
ncbi:MAG: sensor histidine kinase [Gammaproteobacteria bacterium]|nr:sensor histidine kinase [Gammaproteobacteria bacterium]